MFTSHISYLRRRESAAYTPPPHRPGARACEGSVGGWEGAVPSSLQWVLLVFQEDLIVLLETLNVLMWGADHRSPYLLITSAGPPVFF